MSLDDFTKIANGFKQRAGIDMPVLPGYNEERGMFYAIMPGIMLTGNPVTGAITVNWGIGHRSGRGHCAMIKDWNGVFGNA